MGKLKNAAISETLRSPNRPTARRDAAPARSVEDGRGGAPRECPPRTNRGDTNRATLAKLERLQIVVTESGEIKTIAVRVPCGDQVAMIDTLRFTVSEQTFCKTAGRQLVGDDEFVCEASQVLTEIFGFGVTKDLQVKRDFYLSAWELGDAYGYVAIGGSSQRGTMLVNLTGHGCLAAKPGWEGRLYDFLSQTAGRPTITRVDLAHDCMEGEYTVDQADDWYDDGLFSCSGRAPSHEHRGDWRNPSGKGRSLYVGRRKNGKMCRVYEKGMEQGDETSPWVRFEVELRNDKRVIPLDVLLDPSGYFVGAYPCLRFFEQARTPQRVEVKRKAAEINVDASVKNIRISYGKYFAVLRPLIGDEALLEAITSTSGEWPERLKVPDYEVCESPVHQRATPCAFNDLDPSDDGWAEDAVFHPAMDYTGASNEVRKQREGAGHEGEQGHDGQRPDVR
ncbi:replication initiation factor domain-containing protein [Trinickia dinghuensis]|uniref:Phage replication protein n=1 Tax=Trinickia dinghuensis TaxID=2291023 RepID=A0A3D8JWC8_9BURK|nr:replication initiation factor domain-containing protein [Trinickia dinghuensis]RDU96681.1 phage replication protein [Trinickia dinghuensis]